jgi:hypothetical protein
MPCDDMESSLTYLSDFSGEESKKSLRRSSLADNITNDNLNKNDMDTSRILKNETNQNPQVSTPVGSNSVPHSSHSGGPNIASSTTPDPGSHTEGVSSYKRKRTSDSELDKQSSIYKLWLETEDPKSLLRDNQPAEVLLRYIKSWKMANKMRSKLVQNPCLADSDMLKGAVAWLEEFDWFSDSYCKACKRHQHELWNDLSGLIF